MLSIRTFLIACYCSAYSVKITRSAAITLEIFTSQEFQSFGPHQSVVKCLCVSTYPFFSHRRLRFVFICLQQCAVSIYNASFKRVSPTVYKSTPHNADRNDNQVALFSSYQYEKYQKWNILKNDVFPKTLFFRSFKKNLWFISVSVNFTVDDTRKSINRFAFSNKNASFGTRQYKS